MSEHDYAAVQTEEVESLTEEYRITQETHLNKSAVFCRSKKGGQRLNGGISK